jgi:hypothetical protein
MIYVHHVPQTDAAARLSALLADSRGVPRQSVATESSSAEPSGR